MPDLLAGSTIRALDTSPTTQDFQADSYTFTSAVLTTAVTGGTYLDCAVVFTAPTTGRVLLSLGGRLSNTTSGTVSLAPEVREGATVGSGGIVHAASFDTSVQVGGVADVLAVPARDVLLTGLTPGAVYNARLLHARATSGTASAQRRFLTATPAT